MNMLIYILLLVLTVVSNAAPQADYDYDESRGLRRRKPNRGGGGPCGRNVDEQGRFIVLQYVTLNCGGGGGGYGQNQLPQRPQKPHRPNKPQGGGLFQNGGLFGNTSPQQLFQGATSGLQGVGSGISDFINRPTGGGLSSYGGYGNINYNRVFRKVNRQIIRPLYQLFRR